MYRLVEQPQFIDLALLALGIVFCISDGRVCLILPLVLTGLGLVLLFRRHGVITWKRLVWENRLAVFSISISWALFSQLWVFLLNILHHRQWAGSYSKKMIIFNMDGISGGAANLIRYFFESFHLTQPIDRLCGWGFGLKITQFLQFVYDTLGLRLFGDRGASPPFTILWDQDFGTIWYGPFGIFLFLPVLGYALVRGPRRLKSTALALCGYLYLITLILAWQPANAGLFMPFYVCSGFCFAFFLPPWRITRKGRRAIQFICLLLFFYSFYLIRMVNTSY
jgi:hypothetical protein